MSERKLYLAGFGGNRYETTFEELKKQAFEGKIKRKDKIIVNEVTDGQSKEYVVLCGNIKGLEKYFIQGEAERAVEKRRIEEEKEAARLAREREKEAARIRKQVERNILENRKNQSAEDSGQEHEVQNTIHHNRAGIRQRNRRKNEGIVRGLLSRPDHEVLTDAYSSFSFLDDYILWIVSILEFVSMLAVLVFVIQTCKEEDTFGDVFTIIFGIIVAVIVTFFWRLVYKINVTILWIPFQLAVFQINSINSTILESNDSVKFRDTRNETKKDFPLDANETIESDSFISQDSTPRMVPVPPREV